MQNGIATEAAERSSGGFCFVRAIPPIIAEKAAERNTSALLRIPRGVARNARFLQPRLVSRVSRRENRLWRDARLETREGLRTSDFGLPGPLTTNN